MNTSCYITSKPPALCTAFIRFSTMLGVEVVHTDTCEAINSDILHRLPVRAPAPVDFVADVSVRHFRVYDAKLK